MGTQFACYNPHAGKGNWEQSKENTEMGKQPSVCGDHLSLGGSESTLFMAIIPDSPLCLGNSGALLMAEAEVPGSPPQLQTQLSHRMPLLLGPGLWIKAPRDHEDNRRPSCLFCGSGTFGSQDIALTRFHIVCWVSCLSSHLCSPPGLVPPASSRLGEALTAIQ